MTAQVHALALLPSSPHPGVFLRTGTKANAIVFDADI